MIVLDSLRPDFCWGSFVYALEESLLELLKNVLTMIGGSYHLSPTFCISKFYSKFVDVNLVTMFMLIHETRKIGITFRYS